MSKFIKVMNYLLPVICLVNVFFANTTDAQMAWMVATTGWIAHVLEARKHEQ